MLETAQSAAEKSKKDDLQRIVDNVVAEAANLAKKAKEGLEETCWDLRLIRAELSEPLDSQIEDDTRDWNMNRCWKTAIQQEFSVGRGRINAYLSFIGI